MKEQFADYETAKMLKGLGVNYPFLYWWNSNGVLIEKFSPVDDGESIGVNDLLLRYDFEVQHYPAHLWSEVEQWLWNMKAVFVSVEVDYLITFRFFIWLDKKNLGLHDDDLSWDSPITAKIVGIKQAVKYLYEQQNPKTQ